MTSRIAGAAAAESPSGARFWTAFAAGWVIYGFLFCLAALMEEEPLLHAVVGAVATVGPYALLAVVIAHRRRDLLRPEWGFFRSLALHTGIAVLYSVAGATLSGITLWAMGPLVPESLDPGGWRIWFFKVFSGLFLYALVAGFLMWTESLRRVQESRAVAAHEAVLRARAEAKALRAQFNPHFVFNTLHSLMLLVRADPTAAERAIEDVAELIRYASVLQREEVDTVPLTKELAVARRYLALEKLRLADRLQVEWRVEDEAKDHELPPFSLQTLLENAIKHGLSPTPEGGTLRVAARLEADELVLTVEDDGAGADPERVRGATGHGLGLVRQRLESLYGDAAGIRWRTAPGEGFRVTLRVPADGRARGRRAEPEETDALPLVDAGTT